MKDKFLSALIIVGVAMFMVAAPVLAQSTQISLSTEEKNIELGSRFSAKVSIVSKRNTLGTDLVIKFDPEAVVLKEVIPGDVYSEFSDTTSLVEWNKEGLIHLSGISDFNKGVILNGVMATFEFDAIKVGQTDIEVLYSPSDSTLTGIIPFEGNESNLLTQAPEPLSIEIVSQNWWESIVSFLRNLFLN